MRQRRGRPVQATVNYAKLDVKMQRLLTNGRKAKAEVRTGPKRQRGLPRWRFGLVSRAFLVIQTLGDTPSFGSHGRESCLVHEELSASLALCRALPAAIGDFNHLRSNRRRPVGPQFPGHLSRA